MRLIGHLSHHKCTTSMQPIAPGKPTASLFGTVSNLKMLLYLQTARTPISAKTFANDRGKKGDACDWRILADRWNEYCFEKLMFKLLLISSSLWRICISVLFFMELFEAWFIDVPLASIAPINRSFHSAAYANSTGWSALAIFSPCNEGFGSLNVQVPQI